MASTIMVCSSLLVTGLRSSTLHSHSIGNLRGLVKVSNARRLGLTARARASKLPRGVDSPKVEPQLPVSFWGFTNTAELWNARASLIGITVIFIMEVIFNRGFLQALGFDIGRGFDFPL